MFVTSRLIDRGLHARQSPRACRPSTGKMSKMRARSCTCKRTRRVACLSALAADGSPRRVDRMAAPPAADRSIFITMDDWNDGCLVYGVEVVAPSSSGISNNIPPAMEIRPSAEPVVCWSEKEHQLSTLAVISDGTILALVDGSRRIVIHDAAAGTDAPGPRLHRSKRHHPAMLPVGDGSTVLVMDTNLLRPGRCCFEALHRLPGGDWRADALPDPPVEFMDQDCISCYFATGSRAWITVRDKGTLSLDTGTTGAWRIEGTWELPLKQRGFFVTELGVVIGIPRGFFDRPTNLSERCCQVFAIDVEVRPPVTRHVWEIPPERVEDVPLSEVVSLAYLGNGRFCVARSVDVDVLTVEGYCMEKGTTFTLVDVSRLPGGDLELAKHGKTHCHVWPWGHTGNAFFLQPA